MDPDWAWAKQMWKSIGVVLMIAGIVASSISSIAIGFVYSAADVSGVLVEILSDQEVVLVCPRCVPQSSRHA